MLGRYLKVSIPPTITFKSFILSSGSKLFALYTEFGSRVEINEYVSDAPILTYVTSGALLTFVEHDTKKNIKVQFHIFI